MSLFGDSPPCRAGFASSASGKECEPCPSGRFSAYGAAFCETCSPGSIPLADQSACADCPPKFFSSQDSCEPCALPLLLYDNQCLWWHLPLITVGFVSTVVATHIWIVCRRKRRAKQTQEAMDAMYDDLWLEGPETLNDHKARLGRLGYSLADVDKEAAEMRRRQSETSGTSGSLKGECQCSSCISSALNLS